MFDFGAAENSGGLCASIDCFVRSFVSSRGFIMKKRAWILQGSCFIGGLRNLFIKKKFVVFELFEEFLSSRNYSKLTTHV